MNTLTLTTTAATTMTRQIIALAIVLTSFYLGGCTDAPTSPAAGVGIQKGTLYFEGSEGSGVRSYDFAAGRESLLFDGWFPDRFPSGDFVVLAKGGQELQIVNAAGTSRASIFKGEQISSVSEPRASPDGSRIAFTYLTRDASPPYGLSIHAIVVDRSGDVIVQFDDLASPCWTPDGRLVMSGSWSDPYRVTTVVSTPLEGFYLTDMALTEATPINQQLSDAIQPTVSPDGSRLAFKMNRHIWAMNLDGSGLKQITTGAKEEYYPTWSPDGKSIVAPSWGEFEVDSYAAIAIVPSNPAAPTEMTNSAAIWPQIKETSITSSLGRIRCDNDAYILWR